MARALGEMGTTEATDLAGVVRTRAGDGG